MPGDVDRVAINRAVAILRQGRLVAFPTETVYGLGADATNPQAVQRIFAAKGRPSTNPLIVHVFDAEVARRYARVWPDRAEALARRFWPGPLTLVLPRAETIAPAVSAGRSTVGLRSPDHRLALELLKQFDGPIAAPSANRSNRISPTTADHVGQELGDRVDLIVDGGPCQVGIESTVLDLFSPHPVILRPGAITQEMIERVVGAVDAFSGHVPAEQSAQSPGQQAVHYSPATPSYRFEWEQADRVADWSARHPDQRALALCVSDVLDLLDLGIEVRRMPVDPAEYARQLYSALHEADAGGFSAIFIELPPAGPSWAAVLDRLIRATKPVE
jgi:L-threonylcarbamoyladenylate synthase